MEGFWIVLIFAALIFLAKIKKDNGRTTRKKSYREPVKMTGQMSEKEVSLLLGKTNFKDYYVINNYLIQLGEGKSSQIDHILINQHGIWVIETKTYSGKIYGSEQQQEWTQVLAYGKEKHRFYNPIKQNATHIYHLRRIVGLDAPIYSLVVFVTGDISDVDAEGVCDAQDMSMYIETHGASNITESKMATWYRLLVEQKRNVTITEEEHIQNVQTQQENLQKGICPRCSAKLVLREGKHGKFYGCSAYPKCKFTMNAEE